MRGPSLPQQRPLLRRRFVSGDPLRSSAGVWRAASSGLQTTSATAAAAAERHAGAAGAVGLPVLCKGRVAVAVGGHGSSHLAKLVAPPSLTRLWAARAACALHSRSCSSNSSNSSSSSNSSCLLGLRELIDDEEASADDCRHLRAPRGGPGSPPPSEGGYPPPAAAQGGPPSLRMSLDESAAFAAAAAAQQKLQRLQQPTAPRRRRTHTAAVAAAATAATATAAATGAGSHQGELRLLLPAAVVVAAARAATNNVRSETVWKGLSRRLSLVGPHLTPHQLAVALHATARIKYRDARLVDTFTPLILKQIDDFGVRDIALLLNALRKLEVLKADLIELLVNQVTFEP
ncbi:hypothetical protein Efla_002040 [Eimeria flavescens]